MKNEKKTMKKWTGIVSIIFKVFFLFLSFLEIFLGTALILFAIFRNFFLDLNINGECLRTILLDINLTPNELFILGLYVFILFVFSIAIFAYLSKVLKEISTTGNPFSYNIIKKINHVAVLCVIVGCFYNFVLIIVGVLAFLIASIFDYQKAVKETQNRRKKTIK